MSRIFRKVSFSSDNNCWRNIPYPESKNNPDCHNASNMGYTAWRFLCSWTPPHVLLFLSRGQYHKAHSATSYHPHLLKTTTVNKQFLSPIRCLPIKGLRNKLSPFLFSQVHLSTSLVTFFSSQMHFYDTQEYFPTFQMRFYNTQKHFCIAQVHFSLPKPIFLLPECIFLFPQPN